MDEVVKAVCDVRVLVVVLSILWGCVVCLLLLFSGCCLALAVLPVLPVLWSVLFVWLAKPVLLEVCPPLWTDATCEFVLKEARMDKDLADSCLIS